ncbi:MAG: glycosyltransferase [Candidatus Zixiibacteriota bacterium]
MKKRAVLIGPVLPFRGGIAQHTTMLHRALKKQAELMSISYTKQYPAWLFPGESDRDPKYAGYTEDGVQYLISSLNPLTWRRALTGCKNFHPNCAIIPWWTVFWAPFCWYLARGLRKAGIDVVFFCHNVIEHESSRWKSGLTAGILMQGDRFVVHTNEDKKNLLKIVPDASIRVHPHPVYEQFPPAKGILPRRAKTELLFFGFVRPYKGLDILIEAMGLLKSEDVFLTIAGEFWNGKENIEKRIDELGIKNKIEIISRYLTEDETAEYFARCDIVVLPYRSATGSGVVPLAYHYRKPVLVTDVGGLKSVVKHGETGYIVPPRANDIAEKIVAVTRVQLVAMEPAIQQLKSTMTWDGIAESILESV